MFVELQKSDAFERGKMECISNEREREGERD